MKLQMHARVAMVPTARPTAQRASVKHAVRLSTRSLVVKAAASEAVKAAEQSFMDELRSYSMKLHTKQQAPREGQAEAPQNQGAWVPTRDGYFRFLVESKVVYDAFEDIFRTGRMPGYGEFTNTGLERGEALSKDINYMAERWNLAATPPAADGPGHTYATFLHKIAAENPPAFMCHYYNFYFAHTAGGRMIGAQVSKAALDMWMGDFYKWDGEVKELLNNARVKINAMAEGWSREEKDACLEETMNTFKYSGSLLKLITGTHAH